MTQMFVTCQCTGVRVLPRVSQTLCVWTPAPSSTSSRLASACSSHQHRGLSRAAATELAFTSESDALFGAGAASASSSAASRPPLHQHPTLRLISRRASEGSQPGQRSDRFKLGLVVEGGGMRGVVSGAMLMGLRNMGLTQCFDAVYGASAGAMNAAYFLSGQPHGLDIYTEDLIDGRFLDLSGLLPSVPLGLPSVPLALPSVPISLPAMPIPLPSLLGGGYTSSSASTTSTSAASTSKPAEEAERQHRQHHTSSSTASTSTSTSSSNGARPVMDLEFLVDHVMRASPRALDFEAVMRSPVHLKIVASSLETLSPIILDNFQCDRELGESLKASANVPKIAGPPRTVRGHRLVDAAVFEPVPIASAVKDGCTHVMVLSTRPAATQPAGGLSRHVSKHVSRVLYDTVKYTVMNAPYMKDAWAHHHSGNVHQEATDRRLLQAHTGCVHAAQRDLGSFVLPLYPAHVAGVTPMTTDREKLLQARSEGFAAVERLFDEAAAEAKRHHRRLQHGVEAKQQVQQQQVVERVKQHVPAGGL